MHSLLIYLMTLFWAISIATAASNSGICYDSNHVQNTNAFPCDPEAETSPCCEAGYICLSNGLCEPPVNVSDYYTPYFTSDCTDYSWNSPSACPEICNNNKTNPVNGVGVMPCGDASYCCYGKDNSGCCSTPSLLFSLGSGPVTAQTTLPSSQASATSTTRASLAPTSAASSPPVSSTSSKDSSSLAATLITPSPPSSTTAPAITPSSGARPSSTHVAIGVGAGVGIPAGLAILAGLACLLRRRSNANAKNQDYTKESYVNLDVGDRSEIADSSGRRVQELSGQGLVELQNMASG